ncbi:MAG: hypothetical protein M1820_010075 [Bogoriella megaspora]|nr:MAG: hypothetical protein M1820_010075 [Bogoriella megaspora]
MPTSGWKSLIRFKDSSGEIRYGEPLDTEFSKATIYSGNDVFSLDRTSETATVTELLAACEPSAILCIGLNYKDHAIECNFPIPDYPILFLKTPNSLTSARAPIVIPSSSEQVDYENELCVLTRKDFKNASLKTLEANLSDYVFAYTVGNDVSARDWQMGARSGGQFGYAKSYDGFCPVGPALIPSSEIKDPQNLNIVTKVNGKTVQDGTTKNMIFTVAQLLEFLSKGRTVQKGTLIMTGTPNGVGMFMKGGPLWLKKGDVVECEIEKVGLLRNEFVDENN